MEIKQSLIEASAEGQHVKKKKKEKKRKSSPCSCFIPSKLYAFQPVTWIVITNKDRHYILIDDFFTDLKQVQVLNKLAWPFLSANIWFFWIM